MVGAELDVPLHSADLASLCSHLQEASEREKAALARELHDELGGLLVSAKMDLAVLRRRAGASDPDIDRRCEQISRALDQALALERRLVEQLHPTLLDNMGLGAALRWHYQQTCEQASLALVDDLPKEELPLSRDAAIAIFRVAQEALANVVRHAQASTVELRVEVRDGELVVTIRDDGRGMTPGTLGYGLACMHHRVTALGGHLQARTPENGGTEIALRLPLTGILDKSPQRA